MSGREERVAKVAAALSAAGLAAPIRRLAENTAEKNQVFRRENQVKVKFWVLAGYKGM